MEKKCQICGKSSSMGGSYHKLISKYNPSPKKRKYPNLQKVIVPANPSSEKFNDFAGKKILACTKCIKSLGKN